MHGHLVLLFIPPHDSGEGGPRVARWEGRGPRRLFRDLERACANFWSVTLRCSAEGRASKGDGGTAVQPPPFEARYAGTSG
jgi:hypothetical protein